ncbi:MAG: tail-specific protease, partial [Nitrosomonadales bacterium]|nr:tail-specific protease [Nitrosomonadales bacterium]
MFFLLRLAVIIQATWLSPLSTAESIAQVDKDIITFSSNQAETTADIIKKLTTQHFQKQPIDDALSQNLLTQYLGLLDPTKSYFLQEDINEFQKWKFKLDDLLKSGDLSPGFFIYKRYQQRASKRLQKNIALLESGFIFDLNKDESLSIDTEANKWQDSTKDSDNYWRKKTKEAYLRLKLNDKDPEEVRKLLI